MVRHVTRMKTTQIPNMALHCNIEGNRLSGRPRKQWIVNVKRDLEEKKHQDGGGIGDGEGQKRVKTVHPATSLVVC